MSMHITDKELQSFINKVGYKGCTNCKHQIAPLRACKWAEQGGDGRIHLICPKWDRAESEEKYMMNQYEIDYKQGYDTANDEWLEKIDKIIAEIKGKYRIVLKDTPKDDWAVRWNDCIDEVLEVIDKNKAESEGK